MRKAACWIVRQRRWILALTLILAAVCGVLIPGVQVNSDMTKYLPEDSQMRAGMRLMEAEFPAEEDTCTVRAMFGGLSPEQREKRLEELKELPHVSSVTYAPDSPDYNQGDWALYVLTTEYGYDTPEEAELERTLREDFGASVANDDTSAPEIPLTVYAVAFGVILLILLLACDSYFEPLLFLVTIGVAVALNLGTNYFLGEISDVTAGVAAILQLALSMDYSIILMNRYRQELAVTDDRTKAMENALTASFGAIAGSGFTTIVGLLMLLFMSFQIGTNLGVVLAKGVAFSMLCVFTALPGLILMFHKVIEKTTRRRKPRPERRRNPLQALGGFSYRFRWLIVAIFLLLFAGGYLLQGQTATVYTLSKVDPVAEVFPKDNRLVLLYENQDEVAAGKIVETLSAQSVVRSVVSYAGTLGRSCTVDEMESALSAMDESAAVPTELLRLLYYAYYSPDDLPALTLAQFAGFAESCLTDPQLSGYVDEGMRAQLASLLSLTDEKTITTPLTAPMLAGATSMDETQITQLLKMHFGAQYTPESALSLHEFVVFLTDKVLNIPAAAAMFDETTAAALWQMRSVTDAVVSGTAFTPEEMAQVLPGTDETTLRLLYLYRASRTESDPAWMLSIAQLLDYLNADVLGDPRFEPVLSDDLRAQIMEAKRQADEATKQLRGQNYSRLILLTALPEESPETESFIREMRETCDASLSGRYYLIGASAMVDEMERGFDRELLVITLLTAASIFLVVALTFRSLAIPALLVLIVQCSVFLTVSAVGAFGGSMYYLALLIVECILMGATIDYGILYTSYYRETRQLMGVREALAAAYQGSIHTVLTSGSIMVLITALVGPLFKNPTIEAIVQTLSIGCLSAILLILLILPGLLALFDKWVVRKN